tara:strand:+ start:9437 stop:9838 length:402 start_codon:yes stop_codon:yes gene_type:complete
MLVCILVAIFCIPGCSESNVRDDMVKIMGVVLVDDEPAEGVVLRLHPKTGSAAISSGITSKDGSFQISTYSLGDGAPVGQYVVTFVWSEFDSLTRTQVGDRLGGKYAFDDKSKIEWSVPETDVFDAGTIQLQR